MDGGREAQEDHQLSQAPSMIPVSDIIRLIHRLPVLTPYTSITLAPSPYQLRQYWVLLGSACDGTSPRLEAAAHDEGSLALRTVRLDARMTETLTVVYPRPIRA